MREILVLGGGVGGTLAAFASYQKSETARWSKLIVSAGVQPQ